MNKILTISIAAYNMEQYLPRCLDSLLHPDVLEAIEILVINDGSKDNTLSIARKYEAEYPKTVFAINKENGGHGSTVNLGMSLANGKYFRLLDADDWFDTQLFAVFVEKLKGLDADLILTNFSREYTFEKRTEVFQYINLDDEKVYNLQYSPELLRCGSPWFELPSITFKTKILKDHEIKISECFYSDIEFDAFPLQFVDTVVFLNLNIYKYFIGRAGQSISPEGSTRHYPDHYRITMQMIDFYNGVKDRVSPNLQQIYLRMVLFKITANYVVLLKLYTDRTAANALLMQFDEILNGKDLDLYLQAAKELRLGKVLKPISLWRRFKINIYRTRLYTTTRALFKLVKK